MFCFLVNHKYVTHFLSIINHLCVCVCEGVCETVWEYVCVCVCVQGDINDFSIVAVVLIDSVSLFRADCLSVLDQEQA